MTSPQGMTVGVLKAIDSVQGTVRVDDVTYDHPGTAVGRRRRGHAGLTCSA